MNFLCGRLISLYISPSPLLPLFLLAAVSFSATYYENFTPNKDRVIMKYSSFNYYIYSLWCLFIERLLCVWERERGRAFFCPSKGAVWFNLLLTHSFKCWVAISAYYSLSEWMKLELIWIFNFLFLDWRELPFLLFFFFFTSNYSSSFYLFIYNIL